MGQVTTLTHLASAQLQSPVQPQPQSLTAAEVCAVFNRVFAADATQLIAGGDEPLYLPALAGNPLASIVYARGLVQSCMHEVAHWLRAGDARRELVDYGYWYIPEGRSAQQQQQFERHEIAVQGVEWFMSVAAGVHFRISADNLESPNPSAAFVTAVHASTATFMGAASLPPRWRDFVQQLCAASGRQIALLGDDPAYNVDLL